jgi:hypothetical protein
VKRPVLQAYLDTCSLDVACPNCQAEAGHWCVRENGSAKACPCVDRVVAAGAIADTEPKYRDPSTPTHERPGL